MKQTILAGIFASFLVAGFVFYPLLVGSSQSAKAMNVEFTPSGVNKQVTLVTNETVVQVAPDNALHPGGIEYNAYTFNGTIPGPALPLIKEITLPLLFRMMVSLSTVSTFMPE